MSIYLKTKNGWLLLLGIIPLFIVAVTSVSALAQTETKADAFGSAGGRTSSTNFETVFIAGQSSPPGISESNNFRDLSGFLGIFSLIGPVIGGTVSAQVSCPATFYQNCPITVTVTIDVTETNPAKLLGAYNATLNWDAALLEYAGFAAGDPPFDNPIVNEANTSTGELQFAQFDPTGAGGAVIVIRVSFNVIGDPGSSSVLDLNFSEIISAVTLNNLLPITIIEDYSFTIVQGCQLGDVTGEGECTIFDALIIATYDVGLEIPLEYLDRINQGCGNVTGPVDGDEETTIFDALIIATADVGLPVAPYVVCEPHCPEE